MAPSLVRIGAVAAALVLLACCQGAAAQITAVAPTTAVQWEDRTFSFTGTGIAAGDKLFWTFNRTDCDIFPDNEGGVLTVAADLTVTTSFSTVHPADMPSVLCYSFAGAAYTRFAAVTVQIKAITALASDIGNPYAFVLHVAKTLTFQGVGIADGDEAKWVAWDDAGTASRCATTTEGGTGGLAPLSGTPTTASVLTVATAGSTLAFTTPVLADRPDGRLMLCYKFAGESAFALFPNIALTVTHIDGWASKAIGEATTGVVGQAKDFVVSGAGIMSGDRVKWIAAPANGDEDCEGNFEGSDAYTDGGSSGSPVSASTDLGSGDVVVKPLLISPKLRPWKLCYKHRSEPWRLYPTLQLISRGITSISRALAITGTTNEFTIAGLHFSRNDKAKWIRQEDTCDSVSDSVPGAGAGGSSAVDTSFNFETPHMTRSHAGDQNCLARFTFTKPHDGMVLCFKFDTESYQRFDSIRMSALTPTLNEFSHTAAVLGVATTFSLRGTLGITSGDAIKFVENTAADCEAAGLGLSSGVSEVKVTPNVNPAINSTAENVVALAADGSASVSITFTAPSPDFLPWRLCYRFGEALAWQLFPAITMAVHEVSSIHVAGSPTGATILVGEPTLVTIRGNGINDNDHAKFVAIGGALSTSCDNANAGGSSAQTIMEGAATFTFASQVAPGEMMLCYQFGSQAYKAYPGLAVVLDSQYLPAPKYILQKALVSLVLDLSIEDHAPSSLAETTLLATTAADVATALRVNASRVLATSLQAGSVIVHLELLPSANPAKLNVKQMVALLAYQVATPGSNLYSGVATRGVLPAETLPMLPTYVDVADADVIDWEHVGDTTIALQSDTDAGDAVPLAVRDFQAAGIFQFEQPEYRVAEGSVLTLTVVRKHGSVGKAVMYVTVTSETAVSGAAAVGGDFSVLMTSDVLEFAAGQTSASFEIAIHNDGIEEPHFESFTVTIALIGGEFGAEMGTIPTAFVRIFDWGKPHSAAATVFESSWSMADGALSREHVSSKAKNGDAEQQKVLDELFRGWEVTGNGNSTELYLDVNGLYGVDQAYDSADYNEQCDYAAPTSPCIHGCAFGFPYHETLGVSRGVLALSGGTSHVATDPVEDFPATDLSISMWVKYNGSPTAATSAALFSYAVHEPSHATNELAADFMEVLISDVSNLRFMIAGRIVGLRRGLQTRVAVDDGKWHFIALTWRSDDGQVFVHRDGAVVFAGGPYRTGTMLRAGGAVVVGNQQQRTGCSIHSPPGECRWAGQLSPNHGFTGSIQNVRVWNYVLTPPQVGMGMVWPFERSHVGLVLYWRFEAPLVTRQTQGSDSGAVVRDLGTGGLRHDGTMSEAGAMVAAGTPSTHPNFPCGAVHTDVWHFAFPTSVSGDLRTSYNGRLQFSLLSPSHAGTARSPRGFVVIEGGGAESALTLSYALAGFDMPVAEKWTRYSVVLREDHGWLKEPAAVEPSTAELLGVLANVTRVYVRGDGWVYSAEGSGQEVVYMNNVVVYSGL